MKNLILLIVFSLIVLSCNSNNENLDYQKQSEKNSKEITESKDACCSTENIEKSNNESNNSLYELDLEFTDMNGKKVSLSDFQGELLITSMIFTNCEFACPTIVNNTKAIQEELGNDFNIKYMFVSFDHKRDTPEQLKSFHKEQKLNKDWTFLTGSSSNIRIYSMIFNISYQELDNGDFSHTNAIFLVGKNGEILDSFEGLKLDAKDVAKAIKLKIKKGAQNV